MRSDNGNTCNERGITRNRRYLDPRYRDRFDDRVIELPRETKKDHLEIMHDRRIIAIFRLTCRRCQHSRFIFLVALFQTLHNCGDRDPMRVLTEGTSGPLDFLRGSRSSKVRWGGEGALNARLCVSSCRKLKYQIVSAPLPNASACRVHK